MRIVFFSHYFPPEVNAPAVRTYEHCREWVRKGHEVHVVTCVPNHPQGKVYPGYQASFWPQREKMDGIHVHRVWTYVAPNKGFLRRTIGYMSYMFSAAAASRKLPRPDLVVATSPQFFCACAGFLASKLRRCPWIFELRDIWPESIVAVGAIENRALIKVLEIMELGLYRNADAIVAVTPSFKDNLRKRGIAPEKIHVIPNGIDVDSWERDPDAEPRSELGLGGEFVVSYVGTHGMAHNLQTLLEAADILGNDSGVQVVTVGDGAELEDLREMKARRGLDNVRMDGQVPRDRARLYLHGSDVSVVLLRDAELFRTVIPSKIFEAMAVGNPIILGVRGQAREIVEEADAGVCIPPESPDELARAIRKLKDDEGYRRKLGQNGYRYVRRKFDRNILAHRMLDVMTVAANNAGTEPKPAALQS